MGQLRPTRAQSLATFAVQRGAKNLAKLAIDVLKWKLGLTEYINTPKSGPVRLRKNSTDLVVFRQIFLDETYRFSLPVEPSTIMDFGANVGLSTRYFAARYPQARIFSFEPEPTCYDALVLNTQHLKQVKCYNLAIAGSPGNLPFVQSVGGSEWSSRIHSEGEQLLENETIIAVPSITPEEALLLCEVEKVDLIKMDIEGAEKDIFNGSCEWFRKCRALTLEIHDEMRPGASAAFINLLSKFEIISLEPTGEGFLVTHLPDKDNCDQERPSR